MFGSLYECRVPLRQTLRLRSSSACSLLFKHISVSLRAASSPHPSLRLCFRRRSTTRATRRSRRRPCSHPRTRRCSSRPRQRSAFPHRFADRSACFRLRLCSSRFCPLSAICSLNRCAHCFVLHACLADPALSCLTSPLFPCSPVPHHLQLHGGRSQPGRQQVSVAC
jgi:hypothetical protein